MGGKHKGTGSAETIGQIVPRLGEHREGSSPAYLSLAEAGRGSHVEGMVFGLGLQDSFINMKSREKQRRQFTVKL